MLECPHRPACPGCPHYGMPGLAPATKAKLERLAQTAGLPSPPLHVGEPFRFRQRARLAIRGRAHNPHLGVFETGTHRVVHIPECQVHHPLINTVAKVVRHAIVAHDLPPYSDKVHSGRMRYLQVALQLNTESAQVVIVTNDASPTSLEPFFDELRTRLGAQLHSLFWNGQQDRGNAVLGPLWHHVHGPTALSLPYRDTPLFYPPGAFGQSHRALADRIIDRVHQLVPQGATLVEYYAGVGAIGLSLAARCRQIHFNEVAPASLEGLALGIAAQPQAVKPCLHTHPGPAGSHTQLLINADVVIVDPPRKGLDAELLRSLIDTPVHRLLYVSCGLDALINETQELLASERYKLRLLEAFGMFPYTDHVETLAVFDHNPA